MWFWESAEAKKARLRAAELQRENARWHTVGKECFSLIDPDIVTKLEEEGELADFTKKAIYHFANKFERKKRKEEEKKNGEEDEKKPAARSGSVLFQSTTDSSVSDLGANTTAAPSVAVGSQQTTASIREQTRARMEEGKSEEVVNTTPPPSRVGRQTVNATPTLGGPSASSKDSPMSLRLAKLKEKFGFEVIARYPSFDTLVRIFSAWDELQKVGDGSEFDFDRDIELIPNFVIERPPSPNPPPVIERQANSDRFDWDGGDEDKAGDKRKSLSTTQANRRFGRAKGLADMRTFGISNGRESDLGRREYMYERMGHNKSRIVPYIQYHRTSPRGNTTKTNEYMYAIFVGQGKELMDVTLVAADAYLHVLGRPVGSEDLDVLELAYAVVVAWTYKLYGELNGTYWDDAPIPFDGGHLTKMQLFKMFGGKISDVPGGLERQLGSRFRRGGARGV